MQGAHIFQNTLFRVVSKLIHYFDAKGGQIFQSTLFRGVSKMIHYFDAKGAQIFQNTLFRGVQTFMIILMLRLKKNTYVFPNELPN